MTKILFYSTQSLTGWNAGSILQSLPILESQSKQIVWLTNLKKPANTISKVVKSHNFRISDTLQLAPDMFQRIKNGKFEDWMRVYRRLDPRPLKPFKSLYIMGGILSTGSQLGRHLRRADVFPNDRGQLLFQSQALNLINVLWILKAHNEFGTPLHEWAFDPLELSLDRFHFDVAPRARYQLYHGYDIKEYGARRLDTLQYFFESQSQLPLGDKPLDFVFGYTMLKGTSREAYRKDIQRVFKQFSSHKRRLFARDDALGMDTLVSKAEYMKAVAQAKYTLLLPAYDQEQFSIYRLLEALHVDCLPILHEDVNAKSVERSFRVDLSGLRRLPRSERQRREILDDMKRKFLPFRRGFLPL